MHAVLLPVHIASGGLAIILGAVALLAPKGRWLHRRTGRLFVIAMLAMGTSGSLLALRQSLTNVNVLGGLMTIYFVVTALMTVRPQTALTRRLGVGAFAMVIALAATEIGLGVKASGNPNGAIDGVPFGALFFLASISALAAAGDVRMFRFGPPRGGRRLARHLWRMCFALFIAAASFFSIRARVARVLPAPLTTPMMRALPIMLIFLAMVYWLVRVRSPRPIVAGGRDVR